jgi:hypothetical protein
MIIENGDPPALATWLLDKLGYTRRNAALMGDLLEEFHSGRSRAWYWRQTAIVIAKGMRRQAFSEAPLVVFVIFFVVLAPIDYTFWRWHLSLGISWKDDFVTSLLTASTFGVLRIGSTKQPATRRRSAAGVILLLANLSFTAWCQPASLAVRIARDFGCAALAWLCATVGGLMGRSRSGVSS